MTQQAFPSVGKQTACKKRLEYARHGSGMLPETHVVVGQTGFRKVTAAVTAQNVPHLFPLSGQFLILPDLPVLQLPSKGLSQIMRIFLQ